MEALVAALAELSGQAHELEKHRKRLSVKSNPK
jgi:hypothetical protein